MKKASIKMTKSNKNKKDILYVNNYKKDYNK